MAHRDPRADYAERDRAAGTAVGRKGVPWWLWALLGLLLLGALLFFLYRSRGDTGAGVQGTGTEQTGGTGTTGGTDTTGDTGTTGGTGSGEVGTLVAAGQWILPGAADGELAQYAEDDATATSVQVQSVVADEGFWVGPSEDDRVFVHLITEGESGPDVAAGDMVSFTGTMKENPADAAGTFGVTDEEGASLLEQQGSHVEVNSANLQLG